MTAGALVIFLTYLGRLFRPIQALARASTNIAQAAVGLERVRTVLDADERLPRAAHPRQIDRVAGRVEFRDVTFGYVPARPVLQDISFVRRARPAGRAGRTERQRQVHARQPDSALLRPDVGRRRRSTATTSASSDSIAAPADRIRPAGDAALSRAGLAEHRLRPAGRDARRDHRRRPAGAGPRVHRGSSGGLRHHRRPRRAAVVRRPAAAARHRARDGARCADPDPRRAELRPRHRIRAARLRGAEPAARRPDDVRHRAPSGDDPAGRPDSRPRRGPDRRTRHARRTDRPGAGSMRTWRRRRISRAPPALTL